MASLWSPNTIPLFQEPGLHRAKTYSMSGEENMQIFRDEDPD